MLNSAFKAFCLAFILFLMACQPIQYNRLQSIGDDSLLEDSSLPAFKLGSYRSEKREFKERFLSDKMDWVIVLNSHPDMRDFYQKNLLGSDFLSRFQNYQWKLAWTDMSVDVDRFFKTKTEEESSPSQNKKKSCYFFESLALTGVGLLTFEAPIFAGMGLKGLWNCVVSDSSEEKKEKINFANGTFLPFEYEGEKWPEKGAPHLNSSVKNHSSIFDHTLRYGAKKGASYDAPEENSAPAYPLLSVLLSLSGGGAPPAKEGAKEPAPSFFGEDSVIVYTLITTKDMQISVSPEEFKQSLKHLFGDEKRFKLILITLSEDSPLVCRLKFQEEAVPSKIKELSRGLGGAVLDICSPHLPEELFNEMSKSLYQPDLLS